MTRSTVHRIALASAVLVAAAMACAPFDLDSGRFACSTDADCIDGYACTAGLCLKGGGTTDAGGTTEPDAGDTTEPDAGETTEPDAGDTTEPDAGDTTEPDAGETPAACSIDNGGCSAHATCTEFDGTVTCACFDNYEGNGYDCTPLPPCRIKNGGCSENAICTDDGTNVSCACKPDFYGDGWTCNLCDFRPYEERCDFCSTDEFTAREVMQRAYDRCSGECFDGVCTDPRSMRMDSCVVDFRTSSTICTAYCAPRECQPESHLGEASCKDGSDNNKNGLTDCDDPACAGLDGCP